ncbi:hypothetical protein L9F63_021420, partial [Diploptera punctata]
KMEALELIARIVAAAAEIREHPDMLLRVHQSELHSVSLDSLSVCTVDTWYRLQCPCHLFEDDNSPVKESMAQLARDIQTDPAWTKNIPAPKERLFGDPRN